MKYTFPEDFLWGAASSACQIEAACAEDGKQPNVFDHYSRVYPEKFYNTVPDTEADFYHRFADDIALMKRLGLKTFRFSISWARILSDVDSGVNEKGVGYYSRLLDCLAASGIVPFFDLFHCDLPMFVVDKGGPANPAFVEWFTYYARTCFERFGDRVKLWSTVNEPSINVYGGYATGGAAPFKKDMRVGLLACHHMLLAHYSAVKLYRSMGLGGKIGAVNHFEPVYPASQSEDDKEAAERMRAFYSGWWLEPMTRGRYPGIITRIPYIAEHMPENYEKELQDAFEPMDFLGINYYNPNYAKHIDDGKLCYTSAVPEGARRDDYGFVIRPESLYDAMMYLKEHYGDPEIYITENGYGKMTTGDVDRDADDQYRVDYMRDHIREVGRSINGGARVKGYYCWTIMDTYEAFAGGYKYLFGLIGIDYKDLRRIPRKSYYFYQKLIAENGIE